MVLGRMLTAVCHALLDHHLQLDAVLQTVPQLTLQSVSGQVLAFSRHISSIKCDELHAFHSGHHDRAAQAQHLVIGLQLRQRHSQLIHHE